MMGEVVIGGLIFALQGMRPYLESGWMKQCKEPDHWSRIPKDNRDTQECGFNPLKEKVSCDV